MYVENKLKLILVREYKIKKGFFVILKVGMELAIYNGIRQIKIKVYVYILGRGN